MRTREAGVRRRWTLAALALVSCFAAAWLPGQANATSSCPEGSGCFWSQDNYDGQKIEIEGSDSICCAWRWVSVEGDHWRSVKNRYDNRKLTIGTINDTITCLDPGDSRSAPGNFDRVRVGSNGSRC